MPATMLDIARRLNISQATVSRVLNGKGQAFISPGTRQRVLDVAKEMGFEPVRLERACVAGRTGMIALWVRNPDAPYYASIIRGLQCAAENAGYEILLWGYRDRGGEPTTNPERLGPGGSARWPVDGVLAVDCPKRMTSLISSRATRGGAMPALVGIGSDYHNHTDTVAFHPYSGAEDATQHLIDIGRTNIVHMTAECSITRVRADRASAYSRVVLDAGRQPVVITSPDETRCAARAHIIEQIRGGLKIDALFCINDDVAIGCYRGIRDLGLRVPDDIAIVGFDGILDTEYLDTPLTTVMQPTDELCQAAWGVLQSRLCGPETDAQHMIITPRLVVRESTGIVVRTER